VNVLSFSAADSTVTLDLSPLNGSAPAGVRYAWMNSCCDAAKDDPLMGISNQCKPAACPLALTDPRAPYGFLPANPFMAHITTDGKCKCVSPQICDDTGD
jgi:hypothetical protein